MMRSLRHLGGSILTQRRSPLMPAPVIHRNFSHQPLWKSMTTKASRATGTALAAGAFALTLAAGVSRGQTTGVRCSSLGPSYGNGEKFKVGFCQTNVSHDKKASLANAEAAVAEAASKGAQLVILGEMFSCPYATKYFAEYGERLPLPGQGATDSSPSVKLLCEMAKKHKVWLVGGSVPELEDGKIYNTCLVINPDGGIIAKHRKVHLFDIDVAATATRPAMKFKESDVLTGGEKLTLVDLPWCRMGVGICYDVRFPEMALAMRDAGAKLLVYPGAFNMTTGPAHWSVLGRGRAVDTQSYVAMVSPARSSNKDDYQAWGHSTLFGPWADVIAEAQHEATVIVAEVDPSECDRIRNQVPTSFQKRGDLYRPYAKL